MIERSTSELGRPVGRDLEAVPGDLHAQLAAALFDRTVDGRVVFPYHAVLVDFTVEARGVTKIR